VRDRVTSAAPVYPIDYNDGIGNQTQDLVRFNALNVLLELKTIIFVLVILLFGFDSPGQVKSHRKHNNG